MTPRFAGYAEKIRASFDRQAMMGTFGAKIERIAPGEVAIAAPILDLARQQHDVGHAALTFGLGDSAAGYAALTLMEEAAEVMTVEMKINLMAPAAGDRLLARGRVIRPGRRLFVVGATVTAERDGTTVEVALLQGTMIPV